jgi:release factor glutamine methyltransferase
MSSLADYLYQKNTLGREKITLLAFVCKKNEAWVLAHPEYKLKASEEKLFKKYQQKRQEHWPLAYLMGKKSFYQHDFFVSPAVLIPRPESEIIVETGLEFARAHKQFDFLDLGTGSGALILSLAAAWRQESPQSYRQTHFYAGDISAAALKMAHRNALSLRLDKKITFRQGNLFSPFKKEFISASGRALFIAANLPYLSSREHQAEKSLTHEPRIALVGGRDGLTLYRRLLHDLKTSLKDRPFSLMMEINPQQATGLIKKAKALFPKAEIKKVSDLSGRTRFIQIEK